MKSEKITSKKEGKKRLIWIDSDSGQTEVSPPKHTNKQLDDLKEQLDYFRKQTETLQSQLTEQSQRHDTIVMKLSNTIENQQLLLQEAQNHVPFWEKMFGLAVRSNGNYSLKTCAVTASYSPVFEMFSLPSHLINVEAQRLQLEEAKRPQPLLARLRAVFAPE